MSRPAPDPASAGVALEGALLCVGRVMHQRSRPLRNAFNYPVFFLRLKLGDALMQRGGLGWLFGINRAGLLSFRCRDHADQRGGDLRPWLAGLLAQAGVPLPGGDIWLQTFPRLLGYVFNPVSFWFCHDRDGALRVLVAQVNNTFGETHPYVLTAPDGGPIGRDTPLVCRKSFHVSPFCQVQGRYAFRVVVKDSLYSLAIDYFDTPPADTHRADKSCSDKSSSGTATSDATSAAVSASGAEIPLLRTVVWGHAAPLTRARLLRTVARMPLMTFGVIARIHWQAARLWLGKVPFVTKPAPPASPLTRNLESSR